MDRRPAGEDDSADAVEDPVGFALGFILTHRKTAPSELGAPIAAAPMIGSNRGLRSSALANPFSSSQTAAAAVHGVTRFISPSVTSSPRGRAPSLLAAR